MQVQETILFQFQRNHMKSHEYDKISDPAKIPFRNKINKACNRLAEMMYKSNQCMRSRNKNLILPSTLCYIQINNQNITTCIQKSLIHASKDKELTEYTIARQGWTEAIFESIAWEYLRQAFLRGIAKQKKAYSKAIYHKWATN